MQVRVADLFIYPVKSLGGIRRGESEVEERGLKSDRRWMIVDEAGKFITQRQIPKMATLALRDGENPDDFVIETPEGQSITISPLNCQTQKPIAAIIWKDTLMVQPADETRNQWLSDYLGVKCRLVYMPDETLRQIDLRYAAPGQITSFADGFPILLTNTASLADLNGRMTEPVSMSRFRPNIVIEGAPPFAEDGWGQFHIGSAVLEAVKPCSRCIITTIDQTTGEKTGKEPLKTLATFRNTENGVMFGENLIVISPGKIQVEDGIEFSGLTYGTQAI